MREEYECEPFRALFVGRRKELELDQLMTSRGEGISDRDLEAHKAHHSEPGDATQRAPTSRRATAAATRGGRRNVRSSTPNGEFSSLPVTLLLGLLFFPVRASRMGCMSASLTPVIS